MAQRVTKSEETCVKQSSGKVGNAAIVVEARFIGIPLTRAVTEHLLERYIDTRRPRSGAWPTNSTIREYRSDEHIEELRFEINGYCAVLPNTV